MWDGKLFLCKNISFRIFGAPLIFPCSKRIFHHRYNNDSRNSKLHIAFLRLTTKEEENNKIIYTESVIYYTRTNYSVTFKEDVVSRKIDTFTHLFSKVKCFFWKNEKNWVWRAQGCVKIYSYRCIFVQGYKSHMNEIVFTNYHLCSKSEFHTSFYITFKRSLPFLTVIYSIRIKTRDN